MACASWQIVLTVAIQGAFIVMARVNAKVGRMKVDNVLGFRDLGPIRFITGETVNASGLYNALM